MKTTLTKDPWLTTAQVAYELGLSISNLEKMRKRGRGPEYIKIGRSVRYPLSFVEDYQEAVKQGTLTQ